MNLLNFKRRSRYPIDFRGALDVKSLIVLAAILLNTGASWALSTSVTIRNDTSGEVSYYINDDGPVMGGCGSQVYGKIASAQTLNKAFTACMASNRIRKPDLNSARIWSKSNNCSIKSA